MARLIEAVVGHEKEISDLFRLKRRGRWPHAALFVGPPGVGKKKVALAMAQALVCRESDEACGRCGPCLRIEKQQSESLSLVEPDTSLARPVIKVEKIRELLDSLALAALDGARVVIIDQAHTMNPQAANALLKTLEEPTDNVYFILLGQDVHQFLPTIRSRAQVVRFAGLTYEQVKKIKPGLPDWAYRSCRGQIELLDMLSSSDGTARREESLAFLEQFCNDPQFLTDKDWRDAVKDRPWAVFSLRCWMQMVRDAAVLKTQAQKFILNTDQSARLRQLHSVSEPKLAWLSRKLVEAERDIQGNADAALVFESLRVGYDRVD